MRDQLFRFAHNRWIRAQLRAPTPVQHVVLPRLHSAKEIARLLRRPSLPVELWQGQGQGGPITATHAGTGFSKPHLKSLLFLEAPTGTELGQVPFWRSDQLADLCPGDIQIVQATSHLIRRLPADNAVVVPEFVQHVLDVQGSWQDVRSRFHKTVLRNDLRKVRKYGYEYDPSHALRDFEQFYRQMYLPTMEERHGELSSPMSVSEARQLFRHGCLLRIMREGEWVSGVICHPLGSIMVYDIVGVRDADMQLMKEGATSALRYAVAHWANRQGYRAVNFLGTPPWLETGSFRHKRQWGGTVRVARELHRRIWIRVGQITPAVSRFLKENPVIVLDEHGRLHGLIVVDDPQAVSGETRAMWKKRYGTPGLSSLLVRAVSSFAQGTKGANVPDLVIPLPDWDLGPDGR